MYKRQQVDRRNNIVNLGIQSVRCWTAIWKAVTVNYCVRAFAVGVIVDLRYLLSLFIVCYISVCCTMINLKDLNI